MLPREWRVDFHLSSVLKFTHGLKINTHFLLTCNIPAIKSTTHGVLRLILTPSRVTEFGSLERCLTDDDGKGDPRVTWLFGVALHLCLSNRNERQGQPDPDSLYSNGSWGKLGWTSCSSTSIQHYQETWCPLLLWEALKYQRQLPECSQNVVKVAVENGSHLLRMTEDAKPSLALA